MNKWLELLVGLILLSGAIFLWGYSASGAWGSTWNFGTSAWEFLKGGFIWFVILIGILFVMLGISDLKS